MYLFPVAPLLYLVTDAAISLFTLAAANESDVVAVATFVVTVHTGWSSYLFAIVVAVALVMDARALRDHPAWNPNPWLAAGVAIVLLAGAVLAAPYLLSVPVIAYYVYQRRQRAGDDGSDSGRGPADASLERSTCE